MIAETECLATMKQIEYHVSAAILIEQSCGLAMIEFMLILG